MCVVREMTIGDKTINVADIKMKYMNNIADAASDCDTIDKIVLFGSSIRDTCQEGSDIDLAVFGNQSKNKALTSGKFRRFLNRLYAFDDFNQSYDILYFKTGSKNDSAIMKDIEKGEVLYAR